jgi:hypothetical protein
MRLLALTDSDSPWHSFWIRFGQYAPQLKLPQPIQISVDPAGIAALGHGDALLLYRYNTSWGDLEPALAAARARGVRLLADVDDYLWQTPSWPRQRLVPYSRCLRLCHTVTCSTPPLQELLRLMLPQAAVVLLPNSTPPQRKAPAASCDGQLRLCWTGAAWTRPHDLALLRPLARWASALPQPLRWRHIGHVPGQLSLAQALDLDPTLVETQPLVGHGDYLNAIAGDIGLAPLAPGLFNSFKSELKLLEYSGLAMPWVASAAAPYQELCKRWGWRGRLCQAPLDWITQVEALLEAPQLRQREGFALQQLAHSRQSHAQALAQWQALLRRVA